MLKIGISACFFHADPQRPIFKGMTLQYIEQNVAHWLMQRDVLALMDFAPAISPHLKLMDAALFKPEPMGMRQRLLSTPLAQRLELDPEQHLLFINFEGLAINSLEDISAIETLVTELLLPLGHRVAVVVNYDSFTILPPLFDAYSSMV